MKQTIPTVYPPPPKPYKNNTCKKTPQKLNGFHRGSLAGRQPPPPPHAFLFCYTTSKTLEWHFAGGPMVARHCVLAGIGYVHVLYSALIRFLRFCKTLVRKMHMSYTRKHLM